MKQYGEMNAFLDILVAYLRLNLLNFCLRPLLPLLLQFSSSNAFSNSSTDISVSGNDALVIISSSS